MERNHGKARVEKTKRYARNHRCPQVKFPAPMGPVYNPLKKEGKKARKPPENLSKDKARSHD
jgi:hypothetical protein